MYKTIILPVVLYGCEDWSVTQREEYRLRIVEHKLLRRMDVRGRKGWEAGDNRVISSFINCTLHQILLEQRNQGG
jgi:hypothetical protein